jgi:hypothetical protein
MGRCDPTAKPFLKRKYDFRSLIDAAATSMCNATSKLDFYAAIKLAGVLSITGLCPFEKEENHV